jgi:Ca2+-dependent lipid-binding protein
MEIPGLAQMIHYIIKHEINKHLVNPERIIISLFENKFDTITLSSGILLVEIIDINYKKQFFDSDIYLNLATNFDKVSTETLQLSKNKYIFALLIDNCVDRETLIINIKQKKFGQSKILAKTFIPIKDIVLSGNQLTANEFKLNVNLICLNYIDNLTKQGSLYIIIHKATDLPAVDTNGLCDPYCVIYNGTDIVFKTKIIRKNLSPIWNEHIELTINNIDKVNLKLKVFDSQVFGIDRIISEMHLPIENVKNKWYNLSKGHICVSIQFRSIEFIGNFIAKIGSEINNRKIKTSLLSCFKQENN